MVDPANEILLKCPDRDTFLAAMAGALLPTGQVALLHSDPVIFANDLDVDEIGKIVDVPAEFDDSGEEPVLIREPVFKPGHHVNLLLGEALIRLMAPGSPERRVFAEHMQGHGIEVMAPGDVSSRHRVWA